ncbi:hypothetical protein [Halobacteriovorax sp. HLS]|uniref:hypothetical protein n=1 Tax=Halobacteriovorax sp. HLS TaxID=2234000 RepID=UPI000FDA4AE6|nr:hypothetical protein [Halobacteriovorax sp. HLS]
MTKRLTNFLTFAFAICIFASCVAEKKSKSPKCGVGEEFNKVSQKCINVRQAPTSTLNTLEVYEDSGSTLFTLNYTDVNNDQAIDCQVFDTETNIEIRTPILSSTKADALAILNEINSCAVGVNPITHPVESASAISQMSFVQMAYDAILSTEDTVGLYSAYNLFSSRVDSLGTYCESISGQPILQYYGTLSKNLNTELKTKAEWINKRCYCSAGQCSAELIPGENISGEFGISYNVTEGVDGTSVTRQVQVSVIPVNDLPYAVDFHVTGLESTTTSSLPINFTIPLGRDVESDQSFSLTYEIVTPPVNGTLTSCSIANDGSLANDRNCYYIPTDSNAGVTPAVNKIASLTTLGDNATDGILYQAKTGGAMGEAISIFYKQHPLLNSGNNVLLEKTGREITIYIENENTSIKAIVDAINNDKDISSFLTATSTNTATENTNMQEVSVTKAYLSASNTPFDTFTYRVRDESGVSLGLGYGSIDVELQDDLPVAVPISSLDLIFTEDTEKTLTLSITDAENDNAALCSVNPTDATFVGAPSTSNLIEKGTCTCSGTDQTCTVTLKPKPNVTGNAYFTWNITDANSQVTSTQYAVVTINPVNDVPFARYLSTTHNESATATVDTTPYSFSFASGLDLDGDTLTYTYLNDGDIDGGTLGGCVDGANNINIATTCTFYPKDGNINGVSTTLANGTLAHNGGSITFTAKAYGESGNDITVNLIGDAGAANFTEYITITSNSIINVYLELGVSDLNAVKTAIDSHPYASELVSVAVGTNQLVIANTTTNLSGAEISAHKFNYQVTDSSGLTARGTYHINITPVDDTPVICPYSTYPTVKDCGLSGCVNTGSPTVKGFVPTAADLYYYDSQSAVCYKSSGTTGAYTWSIFTDYSSVIPNQIVHQNGSIKINNIKIDEGGADTTEDANTIRITNVEVLDSGQNLVPIKTENIKFYYGDVAVPMCLNTGTTPTTIYSCGGNPNIGGAAGASSLDLEDLSIEIIPTSSKVGVTDIRINFSEYSGATAINSFTSTFNLKIADVAIQHNGWSSIVASGPKVDHFGDVKDENLVCNYSETKCSGGKECSGTSAEFGTSYADEVHSVYYETTNNKCYYASTAGLGTTTWIEFNTYCGVTPSYFDSGCNSAEASCIGTSTPATAQKLNSLFTKILYVAPTAPSVTGSLTTTCYRSTGPNTWEEYNAFGSVSLKWNPMVLTGSGSIAGYNIFRRLSNEEFDYKSPINKSLVSAITVQYIDNSTNSKFGPIPNTVYFYEVVPVVVASGSSDQFQIRTSDFNSQAVIRVLVPGENKSLVPRDIVNITMCKKLNDSSSTGEIYSYDSTLKTYTCAYAGPGDNGAGKYDLGQDLIVDRFEAGCPYTKSTDVISSCSSAAGNISNDGSCIGVVDPTVDTVSVSTSGQGQVYYNRSTGKCYELTAGTSTWTELDSLVSFTNLVAKYSTTQLPPLVHMSQAKANTFCSEVSTSPILGLCRFSTSGTGAPAGAVSTYYLNTDTNVCYYNNGGTWEERGTSLSSELPSRKFQVAYSDWDYDLVSDSTVNTREGGLSLNSNSKCNTSSANGLTTFYSDDSSPVANSIFTIPGTASSGIRSLMTGSSKTALCISKYGLQDTVGNVTEWSNDRMDCTGFTCQGLTTVNGAYIGNASDDFVATGAPLIGNTFGTYALDGISGPCIDVDSNGVCDGYLTSWIYDQKSNGASRFFIPMGLPAVTTYASANPTHLVSMFFEQIGISSGITSTQMHDDTIVVNQNLLDDGNNAANTGGYASLATGGSFLKGNGSGTYHLELIPTVDPVRNKAVDIGFRCVAPVPVADYIE